MQWYTTKSGIVELAKRRNPTLPIMCTWEPNHPEGCGIKGQLLTV